MTVTNWWGIVFQAVLVTAGIVTLVVLDRIEARDRRSRR